MNDIEMDINVTKLMQVLKDSWPIIAMLAIIIIMYFLHKHDVAACNSYYQAYLKENTCFKWP